MLARKKNIDRKPRIAKMLEKKTMYGSFVTENTAGTESIPRSGWSVEHVGEMSGDQSGQGGRDVT